MELKNIGVWGFVKVFVILGIIFGILAGLLLSWYFSSLGSSITAQMSDPSIQSYLQQSGLSADDLVGFYTNAGKSVLYAAPIISLIASFIASLITALVYNLVAKYTGGIKLNLEGKK